MTWQNCELSLCASRDVNFTCLLVLPCEQTGNPSQHDTSHFLCMLPSLCRRHKVHKVSSSSGGGGGGGCLKKVQHTKAKWAQSSEIIMCSAIYAEPSASTLDLQPPKIDTSLLASTCSEISTTLSETYLGIIERVRSVRSAKQKSDKERPTVSPFEWLLFKYYTSQMCVIVIKRQSP